MTSWVPEETPLLASDPALSRAVCSALERSDHIVIVAEVQGVALRIVATNAEARRVTGYAERELKGQDFLMLTGPETDPAAVAALLAAVQQKRSHHAQLRLRDAAGRPFWLGLHLMPTNERDGPVPFVMLGRDLTSERREREQDQAIQTLLAKVFTATDMPVYVLDHQDRFLMTNPAFDRLIGCAAGSLAGIAAIERYTEPCGAALAAAWAQQDADGQQCEVQASLLGSGAREIACKVTSVAVQRAHLPRLRLIMLRTEASRPGPPRITAGGRIQLIGLEEVRESLGPRWDALKERTMATAEHVISRHLGPGDAFSRTDGDQGFMLCFAGATEQEASLRSASIAREVRRRLIGEGSTVEAAHVFSAATAVPPEAHGLSATELARFVQDRIAERLRSIQAATRTRLVEALKTPGFETEAVRARGRAEPVGVLLRIPQATEQAIEAATAVLPRAETAGLDTDAMLVSFAHEYASHSAAENAKHLIFVPLSSDILLVRKRMESCLEACRAIPAPLRQNLVLIVGAPPGSAARRLGDGLARLRPFCRSLGVALEALEPVDVDVDHAVAILLVDAALCRTSGWEAKLKASLQARRCRLLVRGATPETAPELFARAADLVSFGPMPAWNSAAGQAGVVTPTAPGP